MPTTRVGKKKRTNGRKRAARPPHAKGGREFQALIEEIGLTQKEAGRMFGFASRTSRRYKRGEGKVPISAVKLMRLMARGVITKRQVALA